jgi:hypothetical protein
MKIIELTFVIIMGFLFIKDGFVVPIRLRKQGKMPPRYQMGLVLLEIAFFSFFLIVFARTK